MNEPSDRRRYFVSPSGQPPRICDLSISRHAVLTTVTAMSMATPRITAIDSSARVITRPQIDKNARIGGSLAAGVF